MTEGDTRRHLLQIPSLPQARKHSHHLAAVTAMIKKEVATMHLGLPLSPTKGGVIITWQVLASLLGWLIVNCLDITPNMGLCGGLRSSEGNERSLLLRSLL